jgi:hypothetical protein
MKRALLATAATLGAAALLAPAASAQVYGGVGYTAFQADVNGENVTVGAVMGRVGYKTNPFLGVEGEFSIGVQDDDFNVLGTQVSAGLDSEYGVFATGWLPIPLVGDLFGRVGYAHLSVDADAGGLGSFSQDGEGLAYGAGFQLSSIPFTKLRVEYTRYQPDEGDVDSLSLSALLQF